MKRLIIWMLALCLGSAPLFSQSTRVLLKTDLGDITLMLYDDTPLHKDNFISLVNSRFFDGVLFHRVIANFMIQTGNPQSKNAQEGQAFPDASAPYTLPAEIRPNRYHKKGALAAARKGDDVNPQKESSGSQFYMVQGQTFTDQELDRMNSNRQRPFTEEERKVYKEVGGAAWLDYNYTVFGEVTDGLEVVDRIAAVETGPGNRPLKNIRIISARIIQ